MTIIDIIHRRSAQKSLYIDPEWRQVVLYNKFNIFDVIWNIPVEPLDLPNRRKGPQSFSLAGLLEVQRPDGGRARLVVKKQQNYLSRTLFHPVWGIPTFQREISNARDYRRKGLPTFQPVLFAKKFESGYSRAVLVSEYLEGYGPLSDLIESRKSRGEPDRKTFAKILKQTARVVRRIHGCGFQYGCLYPKHIFVRQDGAGISVRVIDLEKSRYWPLGKRRIYRDLETLYRRGGAHAGRTGALRFLLAYLGEKCDRRAASAIFRKVKSRCDRNLRHQALNRSPRLAMDAAFPKEI